MAIAKWIYTELFPFVSHSILHQDITVGVILSGRDRTIY